MPEGHLPEGDLYHLAMADTVRRPGYWFPLLLFGGLSALFAVLSMLASMPLPAGVWLYQVRYGTLTQEVYFGADLPGAASRFPMGWYWVAALAAGVSLTVTWYRRRDRGSGGQIPLRACLLTGLALAAADLALPLLGLGVSYQAGFGLASTAWVYLDLMWRLGAFPLAAIAVLLGILAKAERSRVLAVITAVYAVSVILTSLSALWQEPVVSWTSPPWAITAVLPALVLLLAGTGAAVAAGPRAGAPGDSTA